MIGLVFISSTYIGAEFEKKEILNGQVEIHLPKEFVLMPDSVRIRNYPPESRPALVYSDKTTGTSIALSYGPSKASKQKIETIKDNHVARLKDLYPTADWRDSGVKEINGKKVGYFEFVGSGFYEKVYNLVFLTDLDGKLLLCSFSCAQKKGDCEAIAHQIMNSMVVK